MEDLEIIRHALKDLKLGLTDRAWSLSSDSYFKALAALERLEQPICERCGNRHSPRRVTWESITTGHRQYFYLPCPVLEYPANQYSGDVPAKPNQETTSEQPQRIDE